MASVKYEAPPSEYAAKSLRWVVEFFDPQPAWAVRDEPSRRSSSSLSNLRRTVAMRVYQPLSFHAHVCDARRVEEERHDKRVSGF